MRTMRVIGGRAACGVAMRCALFPDLSALGSGPDAGSMRDATSDAPDATPVFGCKAMADASFCEDFDDPSPFALTTWSTSDLDSSVGSISIDNASTVSPPNAASFVVPSSAPGCSYLPAPHAALLRNIHVRERSCSDSNDHRRKRIQPQRERGDHVHALGAVRRRLLDPSFAEV